MCGIVGYVGHRPAVEFLLQGLRRLEYRGYDSSGIATIAPDGQFDLVKTAGRIDALEEKLADAPAPGTIGIGHTRWATHGAPTDENAHPHIGGQQTVAIVHNGVIENFRPLRERLESEGYIFRSATDSEVIAHLIASCLERELASADGRSERMGTGSDHLTASPMDRADPEVPVPILSRAHGTPVHDTKTGSDDRYDHLIRAIAAALAQLHGTYGLAILFREYPDILFAARLGSPLVVGVGDGEHFLASDGSPLAGNTQRIVYLADHELAILTADSLRVVHRDQGHVSHRVRTLEIASDDVGLNGYPHYMLKEIFEQPESLQNAMRGRLCREEATAVFGGLNLSPQQLRSIGRILLTACGTSWHAALVGEYLIEEFARIPVEVEYASELRYRNPPMDRDTLLFAITQSGETADTLAALREIKRKGHPTLAICNVVGSSIAQESDGGIYLHAGPEIGVASTKAFTSQCVVLAMLGLYFGRLRHLSFGAGLRIIDALQQLPDQVRQALRTNDEVRRIAAKYAHCSNFLYLGRQHTFPTALEGALKLKEISYIHAEGYPAAEMKHGPIALVDEHTPSVFLMPHGFVYDKVMSNLEEIKARGGPVIAVIGEQDNRVAELADDVILIPEAEDFLQPIITAIPLQLLAYHIAVIRGCDVDKPRNLAKSVTVE
ncbi:MAG TPA: glutamine--fructose-6-phosphate transaminase (isomerizing) [Pirellulales bacterium]|jgi:glucosamine--fructose-6-phosphate aminotransferase (isomerizing)|nr:glutamine--fructose-6-phosphate transaminase (isomerizing) [Pirellulales bacterium]